MRLLGGLRKAAIEMVGGLQYGDTFLGDNSERLPNTVNHQYYLNLVECFVTAATEMVREGRSKIRSSDDRFRPSSQVLEQLNRALAQISHLETTLVQWQRELFLNDGGEHYLSTSHEDVQVSLGWDSRYVIEQATRLADESLAQFDAVDICIRNRELFLSNYYHATLFPNQWLKGKQQQHVEDLHAEAIKRLNQLLEIHDDENESSLIGHCIDSVSWRYKQLTTKFSPHRFLGEAMKLPDEDELVVDTNVGRARSGDSHFGIDQSTWSRLKTNGLRVLTFGAKNWQLALERQVGSHLSVVSGTDALLERNDRADGFHRILIQSEKLNEEPGEFLRKRFEEDNRVLLLTRNDEEVHDTRWPENWGREHVAYSEMDANWLVTRCITFPSRLPFSSQAPERLDPLIRINRLESLADFACHLIDEECRRWADESSTVGNWLSDLRWLGGTRMKEAVASIAEESDSFEDSQKFSQIDLANASANRFLESDRPSPRCYANLKLVDDQFANANSQIPNWLVATVLVVDFLAGDYELSIIGSGFTTENLVIRYERTASPAKLQPLVSSKRMSELMKQHGLTKNTLIQTLEWIATDKRAQFHSDSNSIVLKLDAS